MLPLKIRQQVLFFLFHLNAQADSSLIIIKFYLYCPWLICSRVGGLQCSALLFLSKSAPPPFFSSLSVRHRGALKSFLAFQFSWELCCHWPAVNQLLDESLTSRDRAQLSLLPLQSCCTKRNTFRASVTSTQERTPGSESTICLLDRVSVLQELNCAEKMNSSGGKGRVEGNQRTSLCLPETIGAIKIPRQEKTNEQPLCRDIIEALRLRFIFWLLSCVVIQSKRIIKNFCL